MNDDPNPKNVLLHGDDLKDFIGWMNRMFRGSDWINVEPIDHENIDFFWKQFSRLRYFKQTWVSIPNPKQIKIRARNKSPPF